MNCFNIREIQTLLKARFYADLLHESSRHLFLSKTTINLRFKLQDLNFLNLNSLLINRYGVYTGLTNKTQTYGSNLSNSFKTSVMFGGDQVTKNVPTSSRYFMLLKFLNGEKTSFSNYIGTNSTGTFFLTV